MSNLTLSHLPWSYLISSHFIWFYLITFNLILIDVLCHDFILQNFCSRSQSCHYMQICTNTFCSKIMDICSDMYPYLGISYLNVSDVCVFTLSMRKKVLFSLTVIPWIHCSWTTAWAIKRTKQTEKQKYTTATAQLWSIIKTANHRK